MSVVVPTLHCFYHYNSKLEMVIPPAVLLLFRIVLIILGFLCFHMELRIVLLRSVKNCVEILMELH